MNRLASTQIDEAEAEAVPKPGLLAVGTDGACGIVFEELEIVGGVDFPTPFLSSSFSRALSSSPAHEV